MTNSPKVIIDRKTGHFEPVKFEDRYELLKTKEAGLPPPAEKPEPRPHNVINIMDALRRSIETEKAPPARVSRCGGKTKGAIESACYCVKKTRKRHAVRKMKVGPSESPCRRRLQTAMSCFVRKGAVVNVMVKRRGLTASSGVQGDERK